MKNALFILLLIAIAYSEVKIDNGVLVLTDSNFQEAIKENPSLFIDFYSSKVPSSLTLIDTLRTISTRLEARGLHPVIAQINHPAAPNVARVYRIGSYPVLYYFDKGSPKFYDGDYSEADIELFMEKKLHPDLVMVTTQKEIDDQLSRGFPVLVGHFEKRSSKEFKNYSKAAKFFTNYVTLGVIGDAEVDVPLGQVDIYTNGEKRSYAGKMTVKELKKWLSIKSLPLIVPYERSYMKVIFARESGVTLHLILFTSAHYFDEHPEFRESMEKIATDYATRLFVIHLNDREKGMMEYFGVDPSNLPTIYLVQNGEGSGSKFLFKGEPTSDSIREFIEQYYRNELTPFLKSEEPYPKRDGYVKVLVGSEFESFVYNPNVNVFVEFVVPNCRLCDRLKDDVNVFAGYFEEVPDIDVARIDISKNDVPGVEMKNYPMFVLYTAGEDGRRFITYEGTEM